MLRLRFCLFPFFNKSCSCMTMFLLHLRDVNEANRFTLVYPKILHTKSSNTKTVISWWRLTTWFSKPKAPCKSMQHCWPTTPNIVGCYTLRPFAHPPHCILFRVVGSCGTKSETGHTFSYVQTDAGTPNNVETRSASWERKQSTRPWRSCIMCMRILKNSGRAVQTDPTLLRLGDHGTEKCWELLAQKSDRFQTFATTCNRVCKRTQHVTSDNVGSCWPTMLRPFARGFTRLRSCVFVLKISSLSTDVFLFFSTFRRSLKRK